MLPIHTLQIVQNGQSVAPTEELHGAHHLSLHTRLAITRHSWLAARAGGPGYNQAVPNLADPFRRGVMAHTSPIYVAVGGEWRMANADTAQSMLTLLHGGLDYVRSRAAQDRPGSVAHHHGEDDHQAFLERPFHEARAAVRQHFHLR